MKATGRDNVLVDQLKNIGSKVAGNTQKMLHEKLDPNHMETVVEYRHTEAWKILQFQRATDHIPRVSDIQTLRKNDTEQNCTNHRTTPS